MAKLIAGALRTPRRWSQKDLCEIFLRACRSYVPSFAYSTQVQSMFANSGVQWRHLLMDPQMALGGVSSIEEHYTIARTRTINLAYEAAKAALEAACIHPREVKCSILTTEFPSCPPIDAALIAQLGLNCDIVREPLIGLGCGGTPIGLAAALRYLQAYPQHVVLMTGVECPSRVWGTEFPFYLKVLLRNGITDKNSKHAVYNEFVMACLIGDAAGSLVLVGRQHPRFHKHVGPTFVDDHHMLIPFAADIVGTVQSNIGTRMFIGPEVATTAAQYVPTALQRAGIKRELISRYVVHPGGPKVLDLLEQAYPALQGEHLLSSRASLAAMGNCMSASLYDVLMRTPYNDGDNGIVIGMGPGFTIDIASFE